MKWKQQFKLLLVNLFENCQRAPYNTPYEEKKTPFISIVSGAWIEFSSFYTRICLCRVSRSKMQVKNENFLTENQLWCFIRYGSSSSERRTRTHPMNASEM